MTTLADLSPGRTFSHVEIVVPVRNVPVDVEPKVRAVHLGTGHDLTTG